MQLSETNRKTLMVALHSEIEDCAKGVANHVYEGNCNFLTYPPEGGFTNEEVSALAKLSKDNHFRSAMRKILADNSASVLFRLFNIIDGTGDPDPEHGEWSEVALIDYYDDYAPSLDFLHDEFYATFEDWKAIRKDKGWSLENL